MRPVRFLPLALAAMFVAGCDQSGGFADLQQFMDETRAKPRGRIEPLPVFEPYEAFTYSASALRSPFLPPERLSLEERQRGSREIKPDENRVKDYLEGFAIDDFSMVGTLSRDGSIYALVNGGGGVHRVQVGNYLGRNHGRITRIDDTEIEVVEIVPDGDGGWLERPRTLSLKQRS